MIRSGASPSSSARAADSSADCTIASCITARASFGAAERAFSSISRVSSSWSSEPQLTPMRTGLSQRSAMSMMAPNWRSFLSLKPTLPGLMRYLSSASAAAGMLGEQLVADVVEVADERHAHAAAHELVADVRDRLRGLVAIDGDAHELGAGARQRRDLLAPSRRCRRCRCWSSTARRSARRRRPRRRRRQRGASAVSVRCDPWLSPAWLSLSRGCLWRLPSPALGSWPGATWCFVDVSSTYADVEREIFSGSSGVFRMPDVERQTSSACRLTAATLLRGRRGPRRASG